MMNKFGSGGQGGPLPVATGSGSGPNAAMQQRLAQMLMARGMAGQDNGSAGQGAQVNAQPVSAQPLPNGTAPFQRWQQMRGTGQIAPGQQMQPPWPMPGTIPTQGT